MASIIDKIINESDIIIEVVDARAIDHTRNEHIERKILKKGKPLIIVAMKSDLVDEHKLKEKLKTLNVPTAYASYALKKGYKDIRRLIRIFAHKVKKEQGKEKVKVGVVGYTNAGKSSLIDLLTFSAKAKRSSQPAYTKKYQWIKIYDDVLLIDSAGVIEARNEKELDVLKGNVNPDKVDCIGHALKLIRLSKSYESNLQELLGVEMTGDEESILKSYAKKRLFFVGRGDQKEEDIERASKEIVKLWNAGKIKMFIP